MWKDCAHDFSILSTSKKENRRESKEEGRKEERSAGLKNGKKGTTQGMSFLSPAYVIYLKRMRLPHPTMVAAWPTSEVYNQFAEHLKGFNFDPTPLGTSATRRLSPPVRETRLRSSARSRPTWTAQSARFSVQRPARPGKTWP